MYFDHFALVSDSALDAPLDKSILKRAEELEEQAEDLHDEANELEQKAERLREEYENSGGGGGISAIRVASWMISNADEAGLLPMTVDELREAMLDGEKKALKSVRSIALLYGIGLPTELWPDIPR